MGQRPVGGLAHRWGRSVGLHRASSPWQDEKEQLNEYRAHLSGLAKRARAVVQLKPRDQAQPMRGRVPLQAVCDYKQVEVRPGPAGLWAGRGLAGWGIGVATL